jgi:cellulose synthase (UDP-forming)
MKPPNKKNKLVLRILILIGLISIINFFYWFLNPELIEDHFLFWLLMCPLAFDTLRIVYIWYHYWDISIPVRPKLTRNFKVDILTTYFPGEPYDMIQDTLLAIKRIKYPNTAYLCDEANDSYLKEFCEQNGIVHVTRNNRINAKAGNINNALIQATGDICLILDPDHIPMDNFLDDIIPYFEDDEVGFVQTVQAYYNIEESEVAKGAAEQTFHFYGPVMMTMNSYGTVNAIGANCVFRRKALDSIGGHAPGLSEDMHTAMQLHAKGWKSIYVPNIYTKGLAPASLTSYYKQQLKWSRGTLELLVTVYPKLFKKFSWRQKIHYGILPFHYFSGVIYLLSFLIPIISLFTASTPWKGNVLNFGLLFFPIIICIIGVRFYVQKWVMDKSERGIHIIGGLLQTCTWWVFIIGFIYTIIRKKVPYLPTPKEDKELTSWIILLPNITLGLVSIIAVIYGLSIDFTPFSLFMSGFALLNVAFMSYTFVFAYQKQKNVEFSLNFKKEKLTYLNLLKSKVFEFWPKIALPVCFGILILCGVLQYYGEYVKWEGVQGEPQIKNKVNYIGIFAPKIDNGITNLQNVNETSSQIGDNFDIISLYIAWNKNIESNFPGPLLDSIYLQKSIPMITWEPWTNSFELEPQNNKHVYELITEGYFDSYINRFAEKMKNLERPIFLRFAHEFDNPFYPWCINDDSAPDKFKKAWIHTYEIFKKTGARNVIWIWNPWKSKNIRAFYPGKDYVDWIGINILNYGRLNQDGKNLTFKKLYEPFHYEIQKLPSTPVIISEFGTLKDDQKQHEWFNKAFYSIENNFSEIKSVIYFNSKVDDNWPEGLQKNNLMDWSITENQVIKSSFKEKEIPEYVLNPFPELKNDVTLPHEINKLKKIKGVNLKKAHDWRKDYHVLSRKNLLIDFKRLKRLGINTIKYEGNSIYDQNVLTIAKEFDITISYSFWIPSDIDFVKDTLKTIELKKSIIDQIDKWKLQSNISSWSIQNDVQYNQQDFHHKPDLLFQKRAYIVWLKNLVKELKEIDSNRPLIVDLEVNQQSIYHSKMLMENVPGIDALGLVVKKKEQLEPILTYLKNTNTQFVFSEINVDCLIDPYIYTSNISFFITAWQDKHESNKLTFNGIIDRKGRYKKDYFDLLNTLRKSNVQIKPTNIRILKPARPIYEGNILNYHAIARNEFNEWSSDLTTNLIDFEWSLVKCDQYGNYLAIKDVGKGSKIALKIPEDHQLYRLLLTGIDERGFITTTMTTLNTPLIR